MSVVHETIDGEIAAAVAVGDILGASVALIEDGRVAFVGGYGVAVAGEPEAPGKPVAPGKPAAKVGVETAFAYGSISKVICALLVMRLVEAGYVVLDRPLVGYLPGLSFSNKAYGE